MAHLSNMENAIKRIDGVSGKIDEIFEISDLLFQLHAKFNTSYLEIKDFETRLKDKLEEFDGVQSACEDVRRRLESFYERSETQIQAFETGFQKEIAAVEDALKPLNLEKKAIEQLQSDLESGLNEVRSRFSAVSEKYDYHLQKALQNVESQVDVLIRESRHSIQENLNHLSEFISDADQKLIDGQSQLKSFQSSVNTDLEKNIQYITNQQREFERRIYQDFEDRFSEEIRIFKVATGTSYNQLRMSVDRQRADLQKMMDQIQVEKVDIADIRKGIGIRIDQFDEQVREQVQQFHFHSDTLMAQTRKQMAEAVSEEKNRLEKELARLSSFMDEAGGELATARSELDRLQSRMIQTVQERLRDADAHQNEFELQSHKKIQDALKEESQNSREVLYREIDTLTGSLDAYKNELYELVKKMDTDLDRQKTEFENRFSVYKDETRSRLFSVISEWFEQKSVEIQDGQASIQQAVQEKLLKKITRESDRISETTEHLISDRFSRQAGDIQKRLEQETRKFHESLQTELASVEKGLEKQKTMLNGYVDDLIVDAHLKMKEAIEECREIIGEEWVHISLYVDKSDEKIASIQSGYETLKSDIDRLIGQQKREINETLKTLDHQTQTRVQEMLSEKTRAWEDHRNQELARINDHFEKENHRIQDALGQLHALKSDIDKLRRASEEVLTHHRQEIEDIKGSVSENLEQHRQKAEGLNQSVSQNLKSYQQNVDQLNLSVSKALQKNEEQLSEKNKTLQMTIQQMADETRENAQQILERLNNRLGGQITKIDQLGDDVRADADMLKTDMATLTDQIDKKMTSLSDHLMNRVDHLRSWLTREMTDRFADRSELLVSEFENLKSDLTRQWHDLLKAISAGLETLKNEKIDLKKLREEIQGLFEHTEKDLTAKSGDLDAKFDRYRQETQNVQAELMDYQTSIRTEINVQMDAVKIASEEVNRLMARSRHMVNDIISDVEVKVEEKIGDTCRRMESYIEDVRGLKSNMMQFMYECDTRLKKAVREAEEQNARFKDKLEEQISSKVSTDLETLIAETKEDIEAIIARQTKQTRLFDRTLSMVHESMEEMNQAKTEILIKSDACQVKLDDNLTGFNKRMEAVVTQLHRSIDDEKDIRQQAFVDAMTDFKGKMETVIEDFNRSASQQMQSQKKTLDEAADDFSQRSEKMLEQFLNSTQKEKENRNKELNISLNDFEDNAKQTIERLFEHLTAEKERQQIAFNDRVETMMSQFAAVTDEAHRQFLKMEEDERERIAKALKQFEDKTEGMFREQEQLKIDLNTIKSRMEDNISEKFEWLNAENELFIQALEDKLSKRIERELERMKQLPETNEETTEKSNFLA